MYVCINIFFNLQTYVSMHATEGFKRSLFFHKTRVRISPCAVYQLGEFLMLVLLSQRATPLESAWKLHQTRCNVL